jgi:hypothetical protein
VLSEHLKGCCKGQFESPAHSAREAPQKPLGQWNGLAKGQPLKAGHLILQIPSSHLLYDGGHGDSLASSTHWYWFLAHIPVLHL